MFEYKYFVVCQYIKNNIKTIMTLEINVDKKINDYEDIKSMEEEIKDFFDIEGRVMITNFKLLDKKLWFLK